MPLVQGWCCLTEKKGVSGNHNRSVTVYLSIYNEKGLHLVYQAKGCISLVYHDRRVFLACNALLGYPGMTSNFPQLIPKLVCTK